MVSNEARHRTQPQFGLPAAWESDLYNLLQKQYFQRHRKGNSMCSRSLKRILFLYYSL